MVKKTKQKASLKDLIEKLDWKAIEVYRGGLSRLPPDKITVCFCQAKKDNPEINEVRVRIGHEVLEKLNWKPGDKILPLFDPDYEFHFLLVKTDQEKGYSLSQESKAKSCRIHFRWTGSFALERMSPRKVDFEAHKKQLIFIVNDSKKTGDDESSD